MRKGLFLALCLALTCNAFAQKILHDPITGLPYRLGTYSDIQGSNFLFDDWRPGKVVLRNGKSYGNLLLKFDAHNNKFYYNYKDSLYEFVDDIVEVRLHDKNFKNDAAYDMVFKNTFHVANKIKPGIFVQVLTEGKISLVKLHQKPIVEVPGSGSAYGGNEMSRKFVSKNETLAILNNHFKPVKLSLDFLEDLTVDKSREVKAFIKAKNLNVKKETDFGVALSYYNLLRS